MTQKSVQAHFSHLLNQLSWTGVNRSGFSEEVLEKNEKRKSLTLFFGPHSHYCMGEKAARPDSAGSLAG